MRLCVWECSAGSASTAVLVCVAVARLPSALVAGSWNWWSIQPGAAAWVDQITRRIASWLRSPGPGCGDEDFCEAAVRLRVGLLRRTGRLEGGARSP